jgi:hypothetical protein
MQLFEEQNFSLKLVNYRMEILVVFILWGFHFNLLLLKFNQHLLKAGQEKFSPLCREREAFPVRSIPSSFSKKERLLSGFLISIYRTDPFENMHTHTYTQVSIQV